MDFFRFSQDQRVSGAIQPIRPVPANPEHNSETDFPVQYYLKANRDNEYIDFLEMPVALVSDRLKRLLTKYCPQLVCHPVVLADLSRMRQDLYWQINPVTVDCQAPQTEFYKDGAVRNLVIDAVKAGSVRVFRVAGIKESWIIVNLEVAESILRRDFLGIRLKRVASA
ncbi:MAG TPA: serine protease [Bacillota bacterium]